MRKENPKGPVSACEREADTHADYFKALMAEGEAEAAWIMFKNLHRDAESVLNAIKKTQSFDETENKYGGIGV